MFVNQANLRGLNVTFSTAYNKAFDGVKTNYEKNCNNCSKYNGRDRL